MSVFLSFPRRVNFFFFFFLRRALAADVYPERTRKINDAGHVHGALLIRHSPRLFALSSAIGNRDTMQGLVVTGRLFIPGYATGVGWRVRIA